MLTAPDGTRWYSGVRWYNDGYHKDLPPRIHDGTVFRGVPTGRPFVLGSLYHVFVQVGGDGREWVYRMVPGDAIRPNAAEILRRFKHAHMTATDEEKRTAGSHASGHYPTFS